MTPSTPPAVVPPRPAPSRLPASLVVAVVVVVTFAVFGGAFALRARARARVAPTSAGVPQLEVATEQAKPQAPSSSSAFESGSTPPAGWVGVVVPQETTDLVPRFAGHLASVEVRVGDRVRRGDVVATLVEQFHKDEARIAGAARAAIEADEERLREDARSSAVHLTRVEALAREGLASQDELLRARQEAGSARLAARGASARRAEHGARADLAERSLAANTLRAPFDAVVIARYADTGAAVDPTTRVVRLGALGPPVLRFAAPPADVGRLDVGACVTTGTPALAWRVMRVAPEVDVASHTLTVEASAAGAPPDLLFGEMLRVRRCP